MHRDITEFFWPFVRVLGGSAPSGIPAAPIEGDDDEEATGMYDATFASPEYAEMCDAVRSGLPLAVSVADGTTVLFDDINALMRSELVLAACVSEGDAAMLAACRRRIDAWVEADILSHLFSSGMGPGPEGPGPSP